MKKKETMVPSQCLTWKKQSAGKCCPKKRVILRYNKFSRRKRQSTVIGFLKQVEPSINQALNMLRTQVPNSMSTPFHGIPNNNVIKSEFPSLKLEVRNLSLQARVQAAQARVQAAQARAQAIQALCSTSKKSSVKKYRSRKNRQRYFKKFFKGKRQSEINQLGKKGEATNNESFNMLRTAGVPKFTSTPLQRVPNNKLIKSGFPSQESTVQNDVPQVGAQLRKCPSIVPNENLYKTEAAPKKLCTKSIGSDVLELGLDTVDYKYFENERSAIESKVSDGLAMIRYEYASGTSSSLQIIDAEVDILEISSICSMEIYTRSMGQESSSKTQRKSTKKEQSTGASKTPLKPVNHNKTPKLTVSTPYTSIKKKPKVHTIFAKAGEKLNPFRAKKSVEKKPNPFKAMKSVEKKPNPFKAMKSVEKKPNPFKGMKSVEKKPNVNSFKKNIASVKKKKIPKKERENLTPNTSIKKKPIVGKLKDKSNPSSSTKLKKIKKSNRFNPLKSLKIKKRLFKEERESSVAEKLLTDDFNNKQKQQNLKNNMKEKSSKYKNYKYKSPARNSDLKKKSNKYYKNENYNKYNYYDHGDYDGHDHDDYEYDNKYKNEDYGYENDHKSYKYSAKVYHNKNNCYKYNDKGYENHKKDYKYGDKGYEYNTNDYKYNEEENNKKDYKYDDKGYENNKYKGYENNKKDYNYDDKGYENNRNDYKYNNIGYKHDEDDYYYNNNRRKKCRSNYSNSEVGAKYRYSNRDDLKMEIVNLAEPNGKIFAWNEECVERAIAHIFTEERDSEHSLTAPRYEKVFWRGGFFNINCADCRTRQFLIRSMDRLRALWQDNGCRLAAIRRGTFMTYQRIQLIMDRSLANYDGFIRSLERQNPDLNIWEWRFFDCYKHDFGGVLLTFFVDNYSFKEMINNKGYVYYGFGRLLFDLYPVHVLNTDLYFRMKQNRFNCEFHEFTESH